MGLFTIELMETRRLFAVQDFSGLDNGAGPNDAHPNSTAAAVSFDAAATAIATESVITFEGAPTGAFGGSAGPLTVAPGVAIDGLNNNGNLQAIYAAPSDPGNPKLSGYDTTAGGDEFVNVIGGTVTITFASPIQFFGAYFSGVQSFFADQIDFSDGSPEVVDIPTGSTSAGGLSFAGFVDPGASITSITINGGSPTLGSDAFGFDDARYNPAAPKSIGALDPGFGSSGLAAHDVGLSSTSGVAADGSQSVLVGSIGTSPTESFGVTRYNSDGSIDTSFGAGGVVNTAFGSTDAAPRAVDVLPDGDIIVAGTATTYTGGITSGSEFAVAEFTSNGALNTAFGTGGQQLISFAASGLSNDVLNSLAVNTRGEIYLAGSSDSAGAGNTDFAIAALASSGALDTAFGTGGKTVLDIGGGDDVINSLAIQKNSEIVAAGSASVGGVSEIALARFLTTGKIDTHFGTKGITTDRVGSVYDSASSVVVQTNGAIVVAGLTASGSGAALNSDFVTQRYTSAGRLDRTFGGSGSVITDFGQPSAATQVVLQSDGEIVVSGKTAASLTSVIPDSLNAAVARYTTRGVLDTSFNGTGKSIISFTSGVVSAGATISVASEEFIAAASSLGSEFDLFTGAEQGVVAVTPGGEILDAGSSGSDTVEAEIVTAGVDLVAKLLSTIPASVLGGAKGTATVSITENGTSQATGTVTLTLQLASDGVGAGGVLVHSLTTKVNLKQGQSHSYRLAFSYATTLPTGQYFLLADAVDGKGLTSDLNSTNNIASSAAVAIAKPTIALAGTNLTSTSLTYGKAATASIDITNDGNVLAHGKTTVDVVLSGDGTLSDSATIGVVPVVISLAPGKSHVYPLHFKFKLAAEEGDYYLLAIIDPANSLGSEDSSDVTVTDSSYVAVT